MTKQIDIKQLIPFMKDGYVAMDKCGMWVWYKYKPELSKERGLFVVTQFTGDVDGLRCFNIKPAEDWTKSLIKVENKDE